MRAFLKRLRKSEVRDVDLIILIDQDILRLEVAVDDAFRVCGRKSFGELPREFQHPLERQLRIFFQNSVRGRGPPHRPW